MSNYSKGAERERQLVKYLRCRGWYAERTAGSHGIADVIALRVGERPRLIQVKTDRTPYAHFGPDERQLLSHTAWKAGADAELCWWPPRKEPEFVPSVRWPASVPEALAEVA